MPSNASDNASGNVSKVATRVPGRLGQLSYRAKQLVVHPLEDWTRRLIERSPDEAINQIEIRAVGLRRTGNHAVLNWIVSQQAGEVFHLNNVAAGQNPYRYKCENLRRYHPEHSKMAEVYRRQAMGDFIARDCLVYSYEDWSLAQVTHQRFERNRVLYLGKSQQRFDVLILRDPFNLFASRLKQGFVATKASGASMVDLWLESAKEFAGESCCLGEDLVRVNYNRWFAEEGYRRQLADQLGMTFSDAGLDKVTGFGGGSSFDGIGVSGRSLDVTNRWRAFVDHPAFLACFENDEIWAYSERIFGHLPGTDSLRA